MPPDESRAGSRSWAMAMALSLFALTYVLLYAGYMQVPDRTLAELVYHHGIVSPGAVLIHALSPGESVQAIGNRIVAGGTVLQIVRGCDGAGVLFLLVAAIVSVRGSVTRVMAGLGGALVFVYLLNLVRIVVLYFAVSRHGSWFDPLHSYVFPTLFVLLAVVYFSLWAPAAGAAPHGPANPA